MPVILNPEYYLPGFVSLTSEADGSVLAGVFANSEEYIAIPVSILTGLDFADTDPDTGDLRKILYYLHNKILNAYTPIGAPLKPKSWVPAVSTNATTIGSFQRSFRDTFTITFQNEDFPVE